MELWSLFACLSCGKDYMLFKKRRVHMSGKEAKVIQLLQLILIYILLFFCSNIIIC